MHNWAVEHNMAVFSAFHWQEEVSSTGNSVNAKSGFIKYCLHTIGTTKTVPYTE